MVMKRNESMPEARHLLLSSFLLSSSSTSRGGKGRGGGSRDREGGSFTYYTAEEGKRSKDPSQTPADATKDDDDDDGDSTVDKSTVEEGDDDYGFFPIEDDEDDDPPKTSEDENDAGVEKNTTTTARSAQPRPGPSHVVLSEEDLSSLFIGKGNEVETEPSHDRPPQQPQPPRHSHGEEASAQPPHPPRESSSSSSPPPSLPPPAHQQHRRQKSALRRGSAYGYGDESIPLDFEGRKQYNKVLPKPERLPSSETFTKRDRSSIGTAPGAWHTGRNNGMLPRPSCSKGLFRVSSEPVFNYPSPAVDHHPAHEEEEGELMVAMKEEDETYTIALQSSSNKSKSNRNSNTHHNNNNNNNTVPFHEGAMKKRISFGTIDIREHTTTIGDNPSCAYGTPVQLDWDFKDTASVQVDDYEVMKAPRRRQDQYHLNHYQRRNLLKLNGHSMADIKNTQKKVNKERQRRERTRFVGMNVPVLTGMQDALESSARKLKRRLGRGKAKHEKAALLEMMDNDVSAPGRMQN